MMTLIRLGRNVDSTGWLVGCLFELLLIFLKSKHKIHRKCKPRCGNSNSNSNNNKNGVGVNVRLQPEQEELKLEQSLARNCICLCVYKVPQRIPIWPFNDSFYVFIGFAQIKILKFMNNILSLLFCNIGFVCSLRCANVCA